jgi:hypothetical protein
VGQRRFSVILLSGIHLFQDIKELWTFKSFRARIFLAAFPTIIAAVIGHFATDRQPPYDFHADQSYVVPPVGREGLEMTINWRVTHHRTCPGTIERQLVDPNTGVIVAIYDPAPADTNGGKNGWLRKTFRVPRDIPGGNIAYQSKLTYHCNWLQALVPALAIRYLTPRIIFYVEK